MGSLFFEIFNLLTRLEKGLLLWKIVLSKVDIDEKELA
jgi:hypothetical protein